MMRMTKKPGCISLPRLQSTLLRCSLCALLLFAACCAGVAQEQPSDTGDALIGFLKDSIAWHHRLQLPGQLANDPSDSIYAGYNRDSSLEVLALIFEFAREQAQQIQLEHPQAAPAAPATPPANAGNQPPGRRLPQLITAAHRRLDQAAADLNELLKQSGGASEKKRQTIDAQIAEQKSELDLAQARLETLESMNAFTAAEAAAGLLGRIADLERTVPELEAMERTLHGPRGESKAADNSKAKASTAVPATAGTTPSAPA